jgi:UDP-N-acetylmuramyl pentapeptide phosphotransferase/UDP-N-acetylglucosamine-1-phosphate transferase
MPAHKFLTDDKNDIQNCLLKAIFWLILTPILNYMTSHTKNSQIIDSTPSPHSRNQSFTFFGTMMGLRCFITLVICTLMFITSETTAFTVVPVVGRTTVTKSVIQSPTYIPQVATTSTARSAIVVDQAITEMVSRSDPLGAIAMAVLVISLWELYTPGRVKK